MAVEELAAAREPRPGAGRVRAGMSGVVARLTTANVLGAASGFVTGPLLARALGASGRGDLQAVLAPLALVPAVLGLGIPAYAYRTLPRGRSPREVIPSLGLPLLALGCVGILAAVPVADALASGRPVVRGFLIAGLVLTPLMLLNSLMASSLAALERWRAVYALTLIPFAFPFFGIVALYLSGRLTVASAATVTIAGSALQIVPALPLLVRLRRPLIRPSMISDGVSFGVKSWVGGLALTANGRLDQVMMITLVPARQLGLYAVAFTISGAYGLVTGAIAPPLMTRIAAGARELTMQAVRITIAVTITLNAVIGLMTPLILSVLFGPQFSGAFPMAVILLAASVPLAAASVLSSALQADGAPLIPTFGELLALAVTVVGLLALLGPLQGIGAAIVSLAAYGVSFAFQLVMAHRRIGAPIRAFLVPTGEDVRWARGRLAGVALRLRTAP
jgi:O-antigen/teichoic acid export membrane protein